MIRLDHDGHEISRDPEPEPVHEEATFHIPRQNDGGYWDRLQRDMGRPAHDCRDALCRCPEHGCPVSYSPLHGDHVCLTFGHNVDRP